MNATIQELELRLEEELNPTEKVDLLNELSFTIRNSNFKQSLKFCVEATELAKNINYEEGLARAYLELGYCFKIRSEYDKAIEIYKSSLEICERINDQKLKGILLNSIGELFSLLNKFDDALNCYYDALDIYSEIGEKSLKAHTLSNMGNIYEKQGNFSKSLEHYLESIQLYYESKTEISLGTLNRIGCIYVELEDYATALGYYNKILQQAKHKNKLFYGAALGNIGVIHNLLKEYKTALRYFNEYLEISRDLNQRYYEALALTNLSDTYMNLNEYEMAIKLEFQVLQICDEHSYNDIKIKALMMMGDIYSQKNDLITAKKYYTQCLELSEKVNNITFRTEILRDIGLLYLKQREKNEAMEYLYASLDHAQRRNAQKDCLEIHKILYSEYKKEGDAANALEQLEKANSIEEEIFNLESEKKLRSITVHHDIEIAEKEKKLSLQEEEMFKLKNIELGKLNEELRILNEEKSEFLNITAHDLKNPLSGITSLSRRLRENADKLSIDEITDYSKQIEDVSHRMFELVTKILDINAIEAGKRNINPELIDPSVIMGVVMFDYRQRALAKNIEFLYKQESLPKIMLDKTALRQILDNLVSNAVKFSPQGGKIYLSSQIANGILRYKIKDEGPGLTEEDKKKLFGKFTRLSAQPTGDENSTGLGLSITKRLTEAMNGKIWCESDEGKGAIFIVEIPVEIESIN